VKKYNTNAVVLKSINYKDKDKIYTLLTEKHGKISAVARGVRKISSRRGGNLDSLNYISIKITEGDKGFKNIDEVVLLDSFKNIKADYDLGLSAYYLAEMVNKNIEEGVEDPVVFKLLKKSLEILDKRSLDVDTLILFFEVQFLKELGYFPKLPSDPVISETIKKLLKGDFKGLEIDAISHTSVFVKEHIFNNLNSSFKSLDL